MFRCMANYRSNVFEEAVGIVKALADPQRMRIVLALRGCALCPGELTDLLRLAPSTVSKHLSVLRQASLVQLSRQGKWAYYRLTEPAESPAGRRALDWLEQAVAGAPLVVEDELVLRQILKKRRCESPTHGGGVMSEAASKPTILFVCTANSARSQMAEGLMRHLAGDRFEALSAGLEPGGVNPLAIEAMKEIGIDISGHRSKSTKEFLGRENITYAVFVCSDAEEKCPAIYPFAYKKLSWPFADPAAARGDWDQRLSKFREIRDQIKARLEQWLADGCPAELESA